MSVSRRTVGALAAAALAISPAGAFAATHHTTSLHSRAEKACKAALKKDGKKKFDAKYGSKNALGKCVSAYEKAHKTKKR
jgi:hypothetical protein